MNDPTIVFAAALATIVAVAILSAALLRAWCGWLELKRLELGPSDSDHTLPAGRTAIAELKERVRRLEAIAAGVDF
jgi:hypothetical protein